MESSRLEDTMPSSERAMRTEAWTMKRPFPTCRFNGKCVLSEVVYRENGRDCYRYPESPYWGAGYPGKGEHCPGTGGKAAMNKTRPKQLSFRVSEEEYQQLQQKILESGKNQQEYILSCVLEKQIVNMDGIKELIPELKRIGNNLNQIAKRCNEGGMLPSEAEVRKHGEELNKVWQSLRQYLQRRA